MLSDLDADRQHLVTKKRFAVQGGGIKKKVFDFVEENPYIFALSGFSVIFVVLAVLSPSFLTTGNLLVVSRQISINAILAIGMSFVILTGGIDLSVGAVAAMVGSFFASLLLSGCSLQLAILITIAIGAAVGLLNGLIITKIGVPAIISTLAMMGIARGSALLFTGGYPISGLPDNVRIISDGAYPLVIVVLLYAIATILLTKLKIGHYLYAIGGNKESAKYSGINTNVYLVTAYVICGITAALAGIMLVSRTGSGQPNAAIGFELNAIAAVVLGGTAIDGGKGHIIGTAFGALTLGLINNGLNLLGINPFAQQIVRGAIIIAAIYFNNIVKKNSN